MLRRTLELQDSFGAALRQEAGELDVKAPDKKISEPKVEKNTPKNNNPVEAPEKATAEINQSIKETGQMPTPVDDSENPIHCITIIGQIEGHVSMPPQNKTTKYEHLIPQLVGLCDNHKIKGVLVILNTVGGDVEAGLALAELIASFEKPVVSLVLGGAHSIGVPIAVASDYSFITQSATMTIHPVRMNGTVIGVAQTFEYFDQMQERIVDFVANNSHITADRFRALMLDTSKLAKDVGTILGGKEAVEEKLIDEIGGLSQAMNKLHALIKEREEDEK
ncbi:MAG: ATP-dependent Clp protease proteolytic subunit [Cellulosilyticaceae bacterium]